MLLLRVPEAVELDGLASGLTPAGLRSELGPHHSLLRSLPLAPGWELSRLFRASCSRAPGTKQAPRKYFPAESWGLATPLPCPVCCSHINLFCPLSVLDCSLSLPHSSHPSVNPAGSPSRIHLESHTPTPAQPPPVPHHHQLSFALRPYKWSPCAALSCRGPDKTQVSPHSSLLSTLP